jgi:Protein of unknown function, DUF273
MKLLRILIFCFFTTNLYPVEVIRCPNGVVIEKYGVEKSGRPKIAFLTVIVNEVYANVVKFGTETKREYCAKHGYDFIYATKNITNCYELGTNRNRHPAWTKVTLASEYLSQYDYLFYSDGDTIIMNDTIPLETLIIPNYDFIVSSEVEYSGFNSGNWFLKNAPWSVQFLRDTWTVGENSICAVEPNWEQSCMMDALQTYHRRGERPDEHYIQVHANVMNSSPHTYKEGDFIIHFFASGGLGGALRQQFEQYTAVYRRVNKKQIGGQVSEGPSKRKKSRKGRH